MLEDRARVYAALGDPKRLEIVERLLLTDRTPAELASEAEIPSNLLAHHLGVLEAAGIIRRLRSEGDGRRRYVTLSADRLPADFEVPPLAGRSVLFVCRQNSARSQLAAALFARSSGIEAGSAGSQPAKAVHPHAVEAGREADLALTGSPRGYEEVTTPDVVVSVCDIAGEEPPPFDRATHLHWSIPDPVRSGRLPDFRAVRRQLERRIGLLSRAMTTSKGTA